MTIIPKIKNDGFIFYDSSCDLYRVVQIHKEVQDMKKENTNAWHFCYMHLYFLFIIHLFFYKIFLSIVPL